MEKNNDSREVKGIKAGAFSRRILLANGLAAAGSIFFGHSVFAKSKSGLEKIDYAKLSDKIKGKVVTPSQAEYKEYAFGEVFNRLLPDKKRSPDVIVRVANQQDVCEAVKFAKANKMKVVVRGGGHNWCNMSLRTGGMMIDLSDLNKVISIDVENRKAVLEPIISNRDVQKHLNEKGLSYPSGHCPPVKLSGYLLSGGMSWNQGVWGPGAGSVEAIEVVTPDGELITASKDKNPDYFWAARGGGSGFFGVATRYHLKLYPLPKYITASSYTYSLADLETVAGWLGETASKLTPNVELSLFLLKAPAELAEKTKDQGGKVCLVTATVFADTEEEAKKAILPLDTCPVLKNCLAKSLNEHVDFDKLFDMSGALWPADRRNKVEATFSNAKPAELFGALKEHYKKTPSDENLVLYAFFTGPNVPAPLMDDACFSMSAHLYGGPWTMWKSEAEDTANMSWHNKCVDIMKPYTAGHYLGESDIVSHADFIPKAFTPKNYARLKELRKKHDPSGVFYAFGEGLS